MPSAPSKRTLQHRRRVLAVALVVGALWSSTPSLPVPGLRLAARAVSNSVGATCESWLFGASTTPSPLPPPSFAVARYGTGYAFEKQVYVPSPNTGSSSGSTSVYHFGPDAWIKDATLTALGGDQWELTVHALDQNTGFTDHKPATMVIFPFISPTDGTTAPPQFSGARVFYGDGWVEDEANNLKRPSDLNNWFGGKGAYPGGSQAPVIVFQGTESNRGEVLAAINNPPQFVEVHHAGGKTGFVYHPAGLATSTGATMRALVHDVTATCPGVYPWQMAAQAYKNWLDANFPTPRYPTWMADSEGQYQIGLQDFPCAAQPCPPDTRTYPTPPPSGWWDAQTRIERTWNEWKDYFGSVVFWGQMSNYPEQQGCGPTATPCAYPRLQPGEAATCCLATSQMHPRYTDPSYSPWLLSFVQQAVQAGYHAGYYTRPQIDLSKPNLSDWTNNTPTWQESTADWLARNRDQYGANAFYLDELGNTSCLPTYTGPPNPNGTWTTTNPDGTTGPDTAKFSCDGTDPDPGLQGVGGIDPQKVIDFINASVPDGTIIENWVDVYPRAGLITGQLLGQVSGDPAYNFPGGPDQNPYICDQCATPILLRYLAGDRLGYVGESGGGSPYWGQYQNGNPNPFPFWMERQAFLLGAKTSATDPDIDTNPNDSNGTTPDAKDPYLLRIKALHDASGWWKLDPRYVDTSGLSGNPGPGGAWNARRFVAGSFDLIAIDNPNQLTGLTIQLRGANYDVPSTPLSILKVNRHSDKLEATYTAP